MRDVKEKMKELNVQLDNLCQVPDSKTLLHICQAGLNILHAVSTFRLM